MKFRLPAPLAFLALLVSIASLSAMAEIRWLERDYDFGLWKEIAGPKTGTSRFINLGPDTIAIVDVKPSCGCTSASFTDTPIAPGDTAMVSYTYDPTMRPGKFEKSVRVSLSDGTRQTLRIRGNVLGTPESLASLFPVDAGEVRYSDSVVAFGRVSFGRAPLGFVNAYVLSQDSILPKLSTTSDALQITPSVDKAGPGDIVTYSLSLNTERLNRYGPVEILAGPVKVTAIIVPDTDRLMLQQQGKSPSITADPSMLDLGQISASSINLEFTVRNEGKAPLELLSIYPSSEAIKIVKYPSVIKPGKKGAVKIEIDPSRLNRGPQRQSIEIISNDPRNPQLSLPVPLQY